MAGLSAIAGALFAIAVEGTSTCPAPAAVEERLLALTAAGDGVVRLEHVERGLRVTFWRADRSEAGSRTIEGEHTCDELADAAAVMIAAWQETPPPVPLPPPPPVPAVVAPPPPPPRRWELGVGVGAGLAGPDPAPSALLVASVGGRLGVAARALVSGDREAALPGGTARWRRAMVALGGHLRREGRHVLGEAHLGAGLSWLSIRGQGFADARSQNDWLGGLEGGARLGWNRAGLRPWLELDAAFWPARSLVYQLPDQRSAALPRLELLATLGLSFGR